VTIYLLDVNLLLALSDPMHVHHEAAHRQITDVYLLALAVHRRGKLATRDQRVAVAAVEHGAEALELITG
jgi:predicted nucleic acid-binding protein